MTYLALIARSRLGYARTAHFRGILSSSQIITVRLDATSYLPHQKLSSGSSGNNTPSTVVVFSLHLSFPNHFLSFPFQACIPRVTESLAYVLMDRDAHRSSLPSLSPSFSLPLPLSLTPLSLSPPSISFPLSFSHPSISLSLLLFLSPSPSLSSLSLSLPLSFPLPPSLAPSPPQSHTQTHRLRRSDEEITVDSNGLLQNTKLESKELNFFILLFFSFLFIGNLVRPSFLKIQSIIRNSV